jgi:hypothetical protein
MLLVMTEQMTVLIALRLNASAWTINIGLR